MSLAINRDNINQLVYNGLLTPRQYSPTKARRSTMKSSPTAYIKYDPDTANKMLDDAGYTKKDANGIRLYQDGSGPISFTIEGTNSTGTTGQRCVQFDDQGPGKGRHQSHLQVRRAVALHPAL